MFTRYVKFKFKKSDTSKQKNILRKFRRKRMDIISTYFHTLAVDGDARLYLPISILDIV